MCNDLYPFSFLNETHTHKLKLASKALFTGPKIQSRRGMPLSVHPLKDIYYTWKFHLLLHVEPTKDHLCIHFRIHS